MEGGPQDAEVAEHCKRKNEVVYVLNVRLQSTSEDGKETVLVDF